MNLLSKDMQKFPFEFATLDVQNVLGDENIEPLLLEVDNQDFAIAVANLVKPEATPKQSNNLARNSVNTNFLIENENAIISTEHFSPSQILTMQHAGNPQDLVFAIKMDDNIVPEVPLLPNQTHSNYSKLDKTVIRNKNYMEPVAANIFPQITASDLIKNIPSGLSDTQILTPIKLVSSTDDTVFIDIGNLQEKIPPNRSDIISAFSLIPARDYIGGNINLPQLATHNLLFTPVGEGMSSQQMQMSIQMPTQISSQFPLLANSVIRQINEPMIEHVGAVQEALQNRSSNTPKDIIVQLSPAELGRVQIRFSFEAGEHVVAQLVAENTETMAVLRQKSGLLLTQLKLSGFENIDLSFDTMGQKNFSEQNSGTKSFENQNGQTKPNFWDTAKNDQKSDGQQLNKDNTNNKARNQMRPQSSQIDIIL